MYPKRKGNRQVCLKPPQFSGVLGHIKNGRYWIRTSDPFRVKEVRYHCANRPHEEILNHHRCPPLTRSGAEEMVVTGGIKLGSTPLGGECRADHVQGGADQLTFL